MCIFKPPGKIDHIVPTVLIFNEKDKKSVNLLHTVCTVNALKPIPIVNAENENNNQRKSLTSKNSKAPKNNGGFFHDSP